MPTETTAEDVLALVVAHYREALQDIAHGVAACDRCGVTYSGYSGPCQELVGVREPYSTCPGMVGLIGRAKKALSDERKTQ